MSAVTQVAVNTVGAAQAGAVVLAAGSAATIAGNTAGVSVAAAVATTTVTAPTASNPTPAPPITVVDPSQNIRTVTFTLLTVNLGNQRVAVSMNSSTTDVSALLVTATNTLGTSVAGIEGVFNLAASTIGTTLGASLQDRLANLIAALNSTLSGIAIVSGPLNALLVSPSGG